MYSPLIGESCADHDVGVRETREQARHLPWVVLPIGVHLHHGAIALGQRIAEPRTHGATDTEVERQVEHLDATRPSHRASLVRRAVVHHEDSDVRQVLADLPKDGWQRLRLVPCREHDQDTLIRAGRHGGQTTEGPRGIRPSALDCARSSTARSRTPTPGRRSHHAGP